MLKFWNTIQILCCKIASCEWLIMDKVRLGNFVWHCFGRFF